MSTDGSALGYAELLRLATSKGLQELDSTIVQIPADQNHGHAVVLASVRTATALYRAVGEAWWEGVAHGQRQQALVLAELRAKTRALCEAVGMPQSGAAPHDRDSAAGTAASHGAPAQMPNLASRAAAGAPAVPSSAGTRGAPAVVSPQDPGTPQPFADTIAESSGDSPDAAPGVASESAPTPAVPVRTPQARPAARSASPAGDGLGPDILQKLLQMTRRIGELKQEELTEEEALAKLDSFFQRAFNHPLAEGTRMEGQRVVQRLASDLARLSQERGETSTYAAS